VIRAAIVSCVSILVCAEKRTIFGFAIWWKAELCDGVYLSTSPFDPTTHWEQAFLPLVAPLTLMRNDELAIQIRSQSSGFPAVQWSIFKNDQLMEQNY
jgi:hypothetical protein